MTIEELKARLAELHEEQTAIQAKADAENRPLNADEQTEIDRLFADFEGVERDIANRERMAAQAAKLNAPAPRKTQPNPVAIADTLEASDIRAPRATNQERARNGWRTFGEFTIAVKNAALGNQVDSRLTNASLTTYGNEGVGADGGFAVPPDFRNTIMTKVMGAESLLSRCDQIETSGYSITVPKDETAPWGTAGIQGYWDGEAGTYTQKKHAFEHSTIKVNKLTGLVPVTDELLQDAPALGSYVQSRAATVLDFKVSDAIINGTGAGMPLGILNAPCTVQQGKESSQVADTVHGLNLVKMWARMPSQWRSSAVWLCHPDVEPELLKAGLQVGPAASGTATGGTLIYMPPGGVSQSPYATLFGRPVVPHQACAALGDVGDLIFAALGQYAAVLKAGGLRTDSSIHLWFDQSVTAFRFTLRMGGQPWWSAAISAKNGSTTYGPFVTLEAR